MPNDVERIATAALLHDIGKFWSRTGKQPPYTREEQEKENTYPHALWGAHFVERYLHDPTIAAWVREHHQPANSLSREAALISLADWLSSGEREEDQDIERGSSNEAALVNILSQINLQNSPGALAPSFFPLTAHGEFDNTFMPSSEVRSDAVAYENLWDWFENTLDSLQHVLSSETPHATWLALMKRFCSRVPAATPTRVKGYVPDISLYEHSRIAAALAACFAADGMSLEKAREIRAVLQNTREGGDDPRLNEPLCRLVCGNLSGIQDFLYAIPRKGAAKTLRARSFVLQLACETVAEYLCTLAGVPTCCILYNGGGRFYLFLPLKAHLEDLERDVAQKIHAAFEGDLSMLLGWVDLTPGDLVRGGITQKWSDAGGNANAKKLRRYSYLARQNYNQIFGSQDRSDRIAPWESIQTDTEDTEDKDGFISFGKSLRDASFLVKMKADDTNPEVYSNDVNKFFAPFGVLYYPCESFREAENAEKRHWLELVQLNRWAKPEDLKRFPANAALTYRLIATHWPTKNTMELSPATFEDIASRSEGIKKLAIFRADVDNLGAIFSSGLRERATVSRVAALSSTLSDFFEGYVNHLASTPAYQDKVGIIYAGGDDLFVIGAWSQVFEFARDLRSAFHQYCGGNPSLSFSGGVVVVDDHLPIRFGAELAHEAEETAKTYERGKNGERRKNALTLFGLPVGFEELDRFVVLRDLVHGLLEPKDGDKLPQGFLRRLFEIWEVYQKERQQVIKRKRREAGGKPVPLEELAREAQWQRWRWLLVYGLRDFAKKAKSRQAELDQVQKAILNAEQPVEDRLGIPLRWVELILRKEEK
ncbi:MAG TPA: type III-A CRISPR-associated protein Cas10/Csm1 [Candidatus Hydrogenedentes bacterium]|nr:type III-A CRISPR-associated protein Cas10/Csm1 [Candidatus Hydrogenedentota bacterium]